MPKWLEVVFTIIFKSIIENVSDPIRDRMVVFVKDMEKAAKQTPNVFDDMLVDLLKRLLVINHES